MQNRMRSARGHSSSPPAKIGKIIRPGENHDSEIRTAATPIPTTASARTKASRRFLVMNCRRARPRSATAVAEVADQSRRSELETMMPKLYRFWIRRPCPDSGVLPTATPPDLRLDDLWAENKSP